MKKLILLRHAEAGPPLQMHLDFTRALTAEGIEQATESGAWLQAHNHLPDYILCSPATRTVQTREHANLMHISGQMIDGLYNGSQIADDYLEIIQLYGGDASALMLVGHNNHIAELAFQLAVKPSGQTHNAAALAALTEDCFAKSGIAVFEADIDSWQNLRRAQLIAYHAPISL